MDPGYEILLMVLGIPGLLLLMFAGVKWPWIPLMLFWFVSVTKLGLMVHVPVLRTVDLTALAAVIMFMCLVVSALTGRLQSPLSVSRRLLVLHGAYIVLMGVSLIWTTAPRYGLEKTLRFGVFSTLAIAAPMLYACRPRHIGHFETILGLMGLLVAVLVIFFPTYEYGRQFKMRPTVFEGNVLNPAFLLGVTATLAMIAIVNGPRFLRMTGLIGAPLMIVAIYRTGSRAMFVQPFIAIFIWVLLVRSRMRWFWRAFVIFGLIGMATLMFYGASQEREGRMTSLFTNPFKIGSGERARLRAWEFCLTRGVERPMVGHGAGSFAKDMYHVDVRMFPHNILLEAIYEQGLLGFLVLSGLLVYAGVLFFRWRGYAKKHRFETKETDKWMATTVGALAAMAVHWDVADARLTWSLIGICVGLSLVSIRSCQAQELETQEEEELLAENAIGFGVDGGS